MNRSAAAFLVVMLSVQFVPRLPTATIAGFVIKANTTIRQPLRDARMELTGAAGTLVRRTDGSGRFVFTDLPVSEYRLAVVCDGFIRQAFPKRLSVAAGQQRTDIVFELDPAPTSAGRVLDNYGEPLANIMVEALRRTYDVRGNPRMTRAASALTDDRGDYRIFWLDPGNYFFYAASEPPEDPDSRPLNAVVPTYFPGVNTADDAKAVRLEIGQEVSVDFRLRLASFWSIKGQVANALNGQSVAASITLTPPADDPSLSKYRAQSSSSGTAHGEFEIPDVAPGSYILMARSGFGDGTLTAFQRFFLPPVRIAPTDGNGISLMLSPPLSLNGRVFYQSTEHVDLRGVKVGLISVDPDFPSPQNVLVRTDGQFTLSAVSPGTYVPEIVDLPGDLYLKAARFADKDILEEALTLEAKDASTPLQLLLAVDGGHIQVSAVDAKGELQPNAKFVLVPDLRRRGRREQYRVATAGEDGLANVRGIPPGTYKLFAWELLEANAYLNTNYLQVYEDSGVPVTIVSGENKPLSARVIAQE